MLFYDNVLKLAYQAHNNINQNYDLYLKKEMGNNQFQITYAKKGEFSEINGKPFLILFDGATISSGNENSPFRLRWDYSSRWNAYPWSSGFHSTLS